MQTAFDAIGIEIANEAAFNSLTENVSRRGEISQSLIKSGVLRGRCLKLGEGVEVWSVLRENEAGEVVQKDFRPAFRARHAQKIAPWSLLENELGGETFLHGFIENTKAEIFFKLQNITEIGAFVFEQNFLEIGLCGLASRAEIIEGSPEKFWRSFDETALNIVAGENDWSLCAEVLEFEPLRNSFSGNDLLWLYLDAGELKLEILVNQRVLGRENLRAGSFLRADIWLQGHILTEPFSAKRRIGYEGVDRSVRRAAFWKHLRREN